MGGGIHFNEGTAWMKSTPTLGVLISFLESDDQIQSNSTLENIVQLATLSGSYFLNIEDLMDVEFNIFTDSVLAFYNGLDDVRFPQLYAYSQLLHLLSNDPRIGARNKALIFNCLSKYNEKYKDKIERLTLYLSDGKNDLYFE